MDLLKKVSRCWDFFRKWVEISLLPSEFVLQAMMKAIQSNFQVWPQKATLLRLTIYNQLGSILERIQIAAIF
jgi:hypothetical protein